MNKKLIDNKSIVANIFLCLPIIALVAIYILEKKEILMSSIPFDLYLLYAVAAFIPAYFYYRFLVPLHEIGHYATAILFKKKDKLKVDIWIMRNNTSCSDWKLYGNRVARIILCAGVAFKFIYCIIIILIFHKMHVQFGMSVFMYVMWMEIVLNVFPIIKESDGYKFWHLNDFYSEKKIQHNEKEAICVKSKYPWILAVVTIVTVTFFLR